jgi:hypothetical protein
VASRGLLLLITREVLMSFTEFTKGGRFLGDKTDRYFGDCVDFFFILNF